MADELWRYYYFLEDDVLSFNPFVEILQKNMSIITQTIL